MTIPIENTRPLEDTRPIEDARETPSDARGRGDYIDEMRGRSFAALAQLHLGVDELVLTDFPDYANIGDSLIALGQAEYWRSAGIRIASTWSWRTLSTRVYDSEIPVAIQGGGNFGGLYADHSEHRYQLTERLRPDTLLIQEPQSVHFTSDRERAEFAARMAPRNRLRLAVRDVASLATVQPLVPQTILAPDSVHMLGRLEGAAPTRAIVRLLRRDDESALDTSDAMAIDWPMLTFRDRLRQRLARTFFEGAVTRTMNRSTDRWFADASRRLAVGITLLEPGETIITDRLHAMLLALQLGRRVIAIDNANGKLSSYAQTWFDGLHVPVEFARDVADAERRA